MDFLIHWPPGPVVAAVQCQGLVSEVQLYRSYEIPVHDII